MIPYLLSFLTFHPLVGAVVIALLPNSQKSAFKWIAVFFCACQILVSAVIYYFFSTQTSDFQMVEKADWITLSLGSLGTVSIDYLLGVDGISLPLIMLSSVVMMVGVFSSFSIAKREKAYYSLYLLLTTSIVGCFLALDFFLFFLFFEFMLLPMYFLIVLWGGPRRE